MPCGGLASPNAEADRGQGRVVLTVEELGDGEACTAHRQSLQQEFLSGPRPVPNLIRRWARPRSSHGTPFCRLDGETAEQARVRNACRAMRDDNAAATVAGALFYWQYGPDCEDYGNR